MKTIKANKDNDLKITDGIINNQTSEDENKKKKLPEESNELEYFTE